MTIVENGPQTIETRVGTLEFAHDFANGYPTDATVEKLLTSVIFNGPVRPISGRCRRSPSRRFSVA